jgi:hypothetical protein
MVVPLLNRLVNQAVVVEALLLLVQTFLELMMVVEQMVVQEQQLLYQDQLQLMLVVVEAEPMERLFVIHQKQMH